MERGALERWGGGAGYDCWVEGLFELMTFVRGVCWWGCSGWLRVGRFGEGGVDFSLTMRLTLWLGNLNGGAEGLVL